jgi:4a-hydroxytetrahydrobiopterin dehydratase
VIEFAAMGLSRKVVTGSELDQRLAELPGWKAEGDRLKKTFVFEDFVAAFGWMAKVAIEAEKLEHHPNWSNVYKTVEVELWTHDVGGLTAFDFALAGKMNAHA